MTRLYPGSPMEWILQQPTATGSLIGLEYQSHSIIRYFIKDGISIAIHKSRHMDGASLRGVLAIS
jgi:hypothetical protein